MKEPYSIFNINYLYEETKYLCDEKICFLFMLLVYFSHLLRDDTTCMRGGLKESITLSFYLTLHKLKYIFKNVTVEMPCRYWVVTWSTSSIIFIWLLLHISHELFVVHVLNIRY
jgi:hypothetical protein